MTFPALTYRVPLYAIIKLAPGITADHARDLYREWMRHARPYDQYTTWQEFWNSWTSATPHARGYVDYMPSQCGTCDGRRWTIRHGIPQSCTDCLGWGTGRTTRQACLWVAVPTTDDKSAR